MPVRHGRSPHLDDPVDDRAVRKEVQRAVEELHRLAERLYALEVRAKKALGPKDNSTEALRREYLL